MRQRQNASYLKPPEEMARHFISYPEAPAHTLTIAARTHDRLDELVPIEPATMKDRQIIEWDKDDIDALRFMKVDCLRARHAFLRETWPRPAR